MKEPSGEMPDWQIQRSKIIGLGESSIHKNYYPQLKQRLSELEQFKTLLSQTLDTIVLITIPDWNCVYLNDAAEDLLGFPVSSLTGTSFLNYISDEENNLHQIPSRLVENANKDRITAELSVIHSSGRKIPVGLSLRIVPLESKIFGVLVIRDITEIKRAETDLLRKHEELGAAYEELTATDEELRANYEELALTENRLRQSEHRNATLLHALPDLLLVLSSEGEILDYQGSDEIKPVLREGSGKPLSLLDFGFDSSGIRSMMEIVNKALNSGNLEIFEYRTNNHVLSSVYYEARILALDDKQVFCLIRDITSSKKVEEALSRATRKLGLLNRITFTEIQTAVFILSGFVELESEIQPENRTHKNLDRMKVTLSDLNEILSYSKQYQVLGQNKAKWQNLNEAFLFAISHLDMSNVKRECQTGDLEIFADPLLENVFFYLVRYSVSTNPVATAISLKYEEKDEGLILLYEDNGPGISDSDKGSLFERKMDNIQKIPFFISAEILDITGIRISETGVCGQGSRFVITVPKGGYRFGREEKCHSGN